MNFGTARTGCARAAWVQVLTVMSATGTIATSAMRVRMAPPFVGRVKAPSSAWCWRAPAFAFVPRTVSGKATSVLALRHRVCGRFGYALDCVVVTPHFSSSVNGQAPMYRWPFWPQGRAEPSGELGARCGATRNRCPVPDRTPRSLLESARRRCPLDTIADAEHLICSASAKTVSARVNERENQQYPQDLHVPFTQFCGESL